MGVTEGTYLRANFGGVDLLITELETEWGRDIAVQSPARGDVHVQQDRGKKLVSTTCTILFTAQPGKADAIARLDQFLATANEDAIFPFIHPLLGAYMARVTDVVFSLTEGVGTATVRCKFNAEEEPEVVIRGGAGVSAAAGLESVTAALDDANAQAADLGIVLPIPDILGQVADWASGDALDTQSVFSQLASISGQINTAIDELELITDLSKWQLYRALILLASQLELAAEAATSDAEQLFDLTFTVSRPLIAVCAELYGATLATSRADDVTRINRIRTPGFVPPGTYKFPLDGASP